MYPPKFNLRHFMQHLAPGGYYLFQIVFLIIFLVWIVDLDMLKKIIFKLNKDYDTVLIFGFLSIGVMCYFIGVVLRLPSVDEIDDISAEAGLREELEYILVNASTSSKDRKGLFYCLHVFWVRLKWETSQIIYGMNVCKHSLSCKEVKNILKEIKLDNLDVAFNKKISRLITELEITELEKNDTFDKISFRDWLRTIAGKHVNEIRETRAHKKKEMQKLFSYPNWKMTGLWAADNFPYPLWTTYTTHLRGGQELIKDFEENLWHLLLEAMRNDPEASYTTRVPFNRCKLFIFNQSPELAAEVYDREAMVRMMAGFFRGLRLGKNIALFVLVVSFTLWISQHIEIGWLRLTINKVAGPDWLRSLHGVKYMMLTSALLYFFNSTHLNKVKDNFRTLRMSESETVFSSYLIALSKSKEKSSTNTASQ